MVKESLDECPHTTTVASTDRRDPSSLSWEKQDCVEGSRIKRTFYVDPFFAVIAHSMV